MRWGVFLIALLVAVVADSSLTGALTVGGVAPAVSPLLAAFVALSALPISAMWACLLLGLVLDLSTVYMLGVDRPLHLVGPNALGYLFAANIILPLRSMVFRRNPLTLAILSGIVVIAAGLVVTLILSLRSLGAEAPLFFDGRSALRELGMVCARALATALLAVPLGWLLVRTYAAWGFASTSQRYSPRR